MSAYARTIAGLADSPFIHRVRWEVRSLYGRRPAGWGVFLTLAGAAVFAGAHLVSMARIDFSDYRPAVIAACLRIVLIATPIACPEPDPDRMRAGFILVRAVTFGVALVATFCLPAVAGAGAAKDRLALRHSDLSMLPAKPLAVFLARVVGAMVPILLLAVALATLCAGEIVDYGGPYGEAIRLAVELLGQLLLIAVISTACSVRIRSVLAARFMACLLVIVALPTMWLLLCGLTGTARWDLLALTARSTPDVEPTVPMFDTLCRLQAGFAWTAIVLATLWGVRGIRGDMGR